MPRLFHVGIEGGQHGGKGLDGFLDFAQKAGAEGAQPSNYMFDKGDGFRPVAEVKDAFAKRGLKLDGISTHCVFWVHTTAWTGSPTMRPFLSPEVAKLSPEKIEQWAEDYLLRFMDYAAELGVKILPMFWGVAFGWEATTGYPWGFFAGPGYDLVKEGLERFVTKTAKLRQKANSLGIYLCHEIHPGTAAMCADDFLMLVNACDGDKCLAVNVDPSHCWEGEGWETRFLKVGDRCYGCHVKNHVIRPNFPMRAIQGDWQKRGMQFTDLNTGDINLMRFAELMIQIGYKDRYCKVMGTKTAPLVVEAESAYRDLDATSAGGIQYVKENLCFPIATASFEDGLGGSA